MQYDIIIIGAGPGGYETAAEAHALGLRVALVEKDRLGGTCLNRGCIPTKCLCAVAEQIVQARNPLPGISAQLQTGYGAAHARIEPIVAELAEGIEAMLEGVDIIYGEGVIENSSTVSVGGVMLHAKKIIIATGSVPAALNIPGAGLAMDSNRFLALDRLPESLAIIGGGVIGLEFASIAAAFGCKVTVLEFCKEILPGIDADMAKRLRSGMSKRGIEIIVDARVAEIKDDHTVVYQRRGKTATVAADAVLMAVGRKPVVPQGLERARVETDKRGFVVVDSQMQTTTPGIFAIGDVNGLSMLAHSAAAQGRKALGMSVNLSAIPAVVFTVPQLATVSAAKADNVVTVKQPYSAIGYALAAGAEGLLKLGYDPADGTILSCAAVGPHAADLVAEASVAIGTGTTLSAFVQIVAAHPSLSEIITTAAAKALNNLKTTS